MWLVPHRTEKKFKKLVQVYLRCQEVGTVTFQYSQGKNGFVKETQDKMGSESWLWSSHCHWSHIRSRVSSLLQGAVARGSGAMTTTPDFGKALVERQIKLSLPFSKDR
jgi:hypothetical protein